MKIHRAYIRQCFKDGQVQLSREALDDIVRELRMQVGRMVTRCNKGNIKRLTPELFYLVLGHSKEK